MEILQIFLAVFGLLNLAFVASFYFQSNKTAAITFYSLISIFASLWSLSTLIMGLATPFSFFIFATYGHYIFGYLAYLSFFWFALLYPVQLHKRVMGLGILVTIASAILLVSIPFFHVVFTHLLPTGTFAERIIFNLPGYLLFIASLTCTFSLGVLMLVYRLRQMPKGKTDTLELNRTQIHLAILANLIAGVSGISLNLLLPLEGNFSFFYINPIIVTVALTGIGLYNFTRYRFFNARLVLAEFFTACIWILSFARVIFYTTNRQELLLNALLLICTTVFGIFLIRSVIQEIRQRETIEKQEKDLETANAQQENLLHFISHEVKGYLMRSAAAFSGIAGGDYGTITPEAKTLADAALKETRKGVDTVMEILDAGNLKTGSLTLAREPFDLKASVEKVVADLRPATQEKNLALTATIPDDSYTIMGDHTQIEKHVVKNLIENAIHYTPKGSIAVSLAKEKDAVRLSVADTGVGLSPEDKARLFTEGGRGAESVKVNIHSTGYGLFIAKSIVVAHHGRIWAESPGRDKGSTFVVELPAEK